MPSTVKSPVVPEAPSARTVSVVRLVDSRSDMSSPAVGVMSYTVSPVHNVERRIPALTREGVTRVAAAPPEAQVVLAVGLPQPYTEVLRRIDPVRRPA